MPCPKIREVQEILMSIRRYLLLCLTLSTLTAGSSQFDTVCAKTGAPSTAHEAVSIDDDRSSSKDGLRDKSASTGTTTDSDNKQSQASQTAEPAEEEVEHAAQKQEKADKAMVEAANKVKGVEIDPKIFEAEKKGFSLGKLHPTRWIFKPVIDIGKQVVHLEKQIMRLQAPIASLQAPMSELRDDMSRVKSEIDELQTDITGVGGAMGDVDGRLARIESQLNKMYEPVVTLKDPVVALKEPVGGVNREMTILKRDLKDLKDIVSLTSTLILVAVVAVGLLVVVCLPLGTAFVWKHRRKIVQKLERNKSDTSDPMNESEDSKQEAAAARR
jgi:hypothetical protein